MESKMFARELRDYVMQTVLDIEKSNERFETFTRSELKVLKIIIESFEQNQNINMSSTSNLLGISKPALSQITNRLEDKGFIKRFSIKGDRKNIYLRLTPKAISTYKVIDDKILKTFEDFVDEVGMEESKKFLSLIMTFKKMIEKNKQERENITCLI